jgi:hypothetical protein
MCRHSPTPAGRARCFVHIRLRKAAVKRMRCTAVGADEVQVSLPLIFS